MALCAPAELKWGREAENVCHCTMRRMRNTYTVTAGLHFLQACAAVLLFLIPAGAFTQLTFYKQIGGSASDIATDFEVHPNGGYVVVGHTSSYTSGVTDMFLARLTEAGDTSWIKVYGGSSSEFAYNVEIQANGQYWITGKSATYTFGNFDYMIMRTDTLGNLLHWNEFGGAGAEEANSFVLHSTSGYYVGGWASSFGAGGSDFYVSRFDGANNLLWARTYGATAGETLQDMKKDSQDNGLLMSGYTFSLGAGGADILVVKTDTAGNLIWNKTYGNGTTDEGRCVQRLVGGDIIVAGLTRPTGVTTSEMMLMRLDPTGDTVWIKSYGGSVNDYAEHVSVTSDGGFLLSGGCGSVFNNDVFIVRTNSVGDTLWTRRYGSTGQDYLYKMIETSTGDLFGVGATSTGGAGTEDALLLRLDSMGIAGCRRINYAVTVRIPTFTISTGITTASGYVNQNVTPTTRSGPFGAIKACETCDSVTANYGYTATNLQVDFFDSSYSAFNRFWDFGDGNYSSALNPTHTYAAPGTYNACLIAGNTCDRDTLCLSIVVTCPMPIANFGAQQSNLDVQLSDSSLNASAWDWDFGDGNNGTLQNPTHSYASPGTYNVCLTAVNGCGVHTDCESLSFNCPPPTSFFTTSPNNYTITFNNQTNQPGAIYVWDFGDGTISSDENPVHTFPGTGSYLVCLTTYFCGWSDNFCTQIAVTCPAPAAAFSVNIPAGGTTADFTDQTSPTAFSWDWDFGDGAVSSVQNPSHTYQTAVDQIYVVCLVVTNSCGVDTLCQAVNVSVTGTQNGWISGGISLFPNPNNGAFTLEFPQSLNGNYVCTVISAEGAEAASYVLDISPGDKRHFQMEELPAGMYLMRIHDDQSAYAIRFVVK